MTENTMSETQYLYVPETMFYGKERRKFIKDWFTQNPDGKYAVNCKHRPQIKDDPDLQYLIKIGFLKTERVKYGPCDGRTYLVKG